MRTEKSILLAFVLNLSFAVLECAGGLLTGSVAILSDAIHDLGDAAGIGVTWILEKRSRGEPDDLCTYGYVRYSVLGGVLATLILPVGSAAVVYQAVNRMFHPTEIHYNGMMLFALLGVCVNSCAALATRKGHSHGQKAVNLHMLEDVLGWMVVLVGAIVMRFTGITVIDPLLSVCVSVWIAVHAIGHLRTGMDVLLEKTPRGMDIKQLTEDVSAVDGILGIHHVHVWSMDGYNHCATMHIVTDGDHCVVKKRVRAKLKELGIGHATLEMETTEERCGTEHCHMEHIHGAGECHH